MRKLSVENYEMKSRMKSFDLSTPFEEHKVVVDAPKTAPTRLSGTFLGSFGESKNRLAISQVSQVERTMTNNLEMVKTIWSSAKCMHLMT